MKNQLLKSKKQGYQIIRMGVVLLLLLINTLLNAQVNISNSINEWGPSHDPLPTGYEDGIIINNAVVTIHDETLYMNTNARIEVYGGGQLILNNTTITSINPGSNDIWQGIYSEGIIIVHPSGGPQRQFNSYPNPENFDDENAWLGELYICDYTQGTCQTYVEVNSGSEISHAKIGIESKWGAIVRCRGVDFIDNEVGVYIHSYTHPQGTSPYNEPWEQHLNACYFMGCNFEWTKSNPNFTQADLKGIHLDGVRGINIGGCNFVNNDNNKYCPLSRGIGIYSYRSSFATSDEGNVFCLDDMECISNCFEGAPSQPGSGCYFKNLSYGILHDALGNTNVGVKNAVFEDNYRGVDATMHSTEPAGVIKIIGCEFNATRSNLDAIFEDIGGGNCYTGSSQYVIKDVIINHCFNDVYDNVFTFDGDNIIHVTINAVPSGPGRVQKNEFINTNPSTNTSNNVIGFNATGSSTSQRVICNTFVNMGTDIKIQPGAVISTPISRGGNSADNNFSALFSGRIRVDNSGNPNIIYIYDQNIFLQDPSPFINVNPSHGQSEGGCGLKCQDLFQDNTWPVGLKTINAQNFVLIYPNPTEGLINIALSENEISGIKIINQVGKIVFNNSFIEGNKLVQIDVSMLSSGIYYIQVQTPEGEMHFSRFVVN
jgi:hypothetical protein